MDRVYLRQLKAGRDFGIGDRVATQMANFVYLIGDREKRECLVVDPAWDVDGILAVAEADGMRVTGALCTHYHPDHVGGSMFGLHVQGLARLLEKNPCPVHLHEAEAEGVRKVTGLSVGDLVPHGSGDLIAAGDVQVELLHTPGHTPGSSCFRCAGALVAGDTLFLEGCGRVDLPGGDPAEMQRTLSQRLMALPDDLILYPGHDYGKRPYAPMGEVKRDNPVFRRHRPEER